MGGAHSCGENLPRVEVEGSLAYLSYPGCMSQVFPHPLQSLENRLEYNR